MVLKPFIWLHTMVIASIYQKVFITEIKRMKNHFDADHIMWAPSVKVLRKINKLAFLKMGDMNWQNHCGIFTAPIIIAEKFKNSINNMGRNIMGHIRNVFFF